MAVRNTFVMGLGSTDGDSDERLLMRAREKPDAFGVVYDRYERVMLGFFVRATGHRADHQEAVEDMLAQTGHPAAPWRVIAAESKPYARATVPEIVVANIGDALRKLGRKPVTSEASL